MASKSTYEFYKDDLKSIPPTRAMAETLACDPRVRTVSAADAYELARRQKDVIETDMPIYPPAAKRLGLPGGATVLDNVHGRIVGRTAQARRFFNRMPGAEKRKVLGDVREALVGLRERPCIKAHAIVGLDSEMMIKATIVASEDDAINVFNWLVNFTPYEELAQEYEASAVLPVPDIIVVGDNRWTIRDPYYHDEGGAQLALVDEEANVMFNFGMRYFGERKKGTLTLAWTSGMRLGWAACHGGIKEFDFSGCANQHKSIGKRSIAFFGLSGTGKSSHTNAADNDGTLPEGVNKVVLHDDAFQIDREARVCRVWEPTLFDKTDSRPLGHPDWEYCISVMNHGVINVEGKVLPLGQDLRNPNGRALFDRDLLGKYVNRCRFPDLVCWLTKDTTLPPILRFDNHELAVAMGASLMTRRNHAENVSEEELKKLVFIPFANPFRVYPLWKDVAAFLDVMEHGAQCFCFNSVGFWKHSDSDLAPIPLKTSLTLQSAILLNQLEWRDWDLLSGAQIPTAESVDALLPGFAEMYNPDSVEARESYISTLTDRFAQRRRYLELSDLNESPELLVRLVKALKITA
ncbi:phosphoenolpyruvate carboxykinase (ATP) [Oceanidesulfovibrio marinus]|uniref:Phosphoenolpyruvate carboxykinase n=1 Tax=Oceanidesulfovibrio marinus TaxID=370038 RepID=A0A6P1ZIC4_9BACT|nr:phosphoenolpyruvate carboxykinase (ATP) [Oceanidesulfovibrio marinus]TVM33089.1 phosphoenolpyruvate carboxykinase [Oceanidesulfovibrio marinus]